MKLLKGWMGIGKDKDKNAKNAKGSVFAPLLGKQEGVKANALHPGALDANVVPSVGLEWMDEKDQK